MLKNNKTTYVLGLILFFLLSLGPVSVINLLGVSYNLMYIEIASITLALIIFGKLLLRNKVLLFNGKEKLMLATLLVVFFYSIVISFYSTEQMTALQGSLLIIFGIIFLYLATYYIYNFDDFFYIANRIFIFSIFVQLVMNMYDMLLGSGLSFYILKGFSETLVGSSNAISFYFTFSFLYEFVAKKRFWTLFSLINGAGIILSISRGAIVSLVICIGIYILISLLNKHFRNISTIFYLLTLVAVFYILLEFTGPGKQLMQGLQFGLKATSIGSRETLVGIAVQNIYDNPFGNGIVWKNDPHNIVIRLIRDLGIFVGFAFLIFLFYPIQYFFKTKLVNYSREVMALLIGYLSICLHSLAEIYFLTSTTLFYTLFILVYINKLTTYKNVESEKKGESI